MSVRFEKKNTKKWFVSTYQLEISQLHVVLMLNLSQFMLQNTEKEIANLVNNM